MRIDDRDVGPAPVVVELGRGSHTIEVAADGYTTTRQDFPAKLDHASDLSFTLVRAGAPVATTTSPDTWSTLPPPPPPPVVDTPASTGLVTSAPRKPYVWAWATTALLVLAVGEGVVMGVLKLNTQNNLKAGTGGFAATRTLADTAVALSWGADIGYGVGGAAGIASVLLFIFEGH